MVLFAVFEAKFNLNKGNNKQYDYMNIRSRFFIPLIILVAAFVIHLQYVWSPKLYSYIKAKDTEHLQSHLKTVVDGLTPLMLNNQLDSIYAMLNVVLKSNANWQALYLYDAKGRILYPINANEPLKLDDEFQVEFVQPIHYLEQRLGKIVVIIDASDDYYQVENFQNEMLKIFLLGLSLFIISMIFLIHFLLDNPLKKLIEASNALAKGEFNAVLPPKGKDEIGRLVNSFFLMRNAIEASQVKLIKEITEHKKTTEELTIEKERASFQAEHDALTGLFNRREFERKLGRLISLAVKENTSHAMLYIDLDQFKVVNDTCGHVAGDALLKQLSAMLIHRIREDDTLARLGGDEFGLLVEYCSLDDAEKIANQLKEQIQDFHYEWNGSVFRVGASIGLVAINKTSYSIDLIMSAADTACYAAKDTGRNRVHVYKPDDIEVVTRYGEMQWVAKITKALDEELLVLYQQNVMLSDAPHEKLEYSEILVRMKDGNGGLIPPGAFLPAAERYNLAPDIDRFVIESVFKYISKLDDIGETTYGINLSQMSIGSEGFLAFILDKFKEYNVLGKNICFEITETAAVKDLNVAINFIKALRQYGCRFALDDFGRGLSSLVYLKTLPVDYLKIDGLFVKDIIYDAVDLAMVKSIHEIGHVMNMKTIAEFVENEEVYLQLKEIGVDCVQGNWVGEPVELVTNGVTKTVKVKNLSSI